MSTSASTFAPVQWFEAVDSPPRQLSLGDESAVRLSERLVQEVNRSRGREEFLSRTIPGIVQGWAALWGALFRRTPEWQAEFEHGRSELDGLPFESFADALDRNCVAFLAGRTPRDWSLLVIPLAHAREATELLVLGGPGLAEREASLAIEIGRIVAHCLSACERMHQFEQRAERLRATLDIASTFTLVHETEPLLELIANEATRLLGCDRASIFIRDEERREVVACPALGVDQATLRLPDDKGIVGEVIHTASIVQVDDAYNDARFDSSVDQASGYQTRNLLCVPLRDHENKLIGAFEVINKLEGEFRKDDSDALALLGTQAATALRNTREREQMVRSQQQLTEQVTEGVRIIGESPAIVALRDTIGRLASTDLPVLVLGESGTGKEVVAQSLHYQGARAEHPFVAVNCAAISETLLESELFGHEKGAFTDAHDARAGKFELAEGGTLFLDEIGDMSPGGQAKLLRVLEQKIVTRVGGSQNIPIDVRVIAATNANLTEAISERRFREDLYYRLSIVTLELPPLRERPEDILPLAEFFLQKFSVQAGRRLQFSADARRRLQSHGWPGNIRELRNLIERVAFLAPKDRVEADDLAFILSPERENVFDLNADLGLAEATKRFQQHFIRRSIKRVNNNMSEAAKLLGLHRSNLYRKMRQLEMHEGDEGE